MTDEAMESSKRVLEPIERISEILFGLIMVLTITASVSVAELGVADMRTMLFAALGCNIAWGIIDGVLYLMGCLAEKGRALMTLVAVRRSSDGDEARRRIAAALPPVVASVLQPADLDTIHRGLLSLPEPVSPVRLARDDYLGALAVFLLVFCSTLPVVVPFLVLRDAALALRVSHAIGILLLFVTGYLFGRAAGRGPWAMGSSMVVLGSLLVGLAIALGG